MESSNLKYTEISSVDLPALSEVMLNKEHMKFSVNFSSISECTTYIETLSKQWKTLGFGCWRVIEKCSAETIGWGGIVIDENDPEWGPELIYYISPQKVGKGYASELSKFACYYAFNSVGLKKISAFAHPENIASNRVLEKIGFNKTSYLSAMNRNYYELAAGT